MNQTFKPRRERRERGAVGEAATPVEQVRGGARKSGSSAVVLRQGGDLAQVETFYSPQKGPGNCTRPLPSASMAETGRAAVLSVFYELGGPAQLRNCPFAPLWSVLLGEQKATLTRLADSGGADSTGFFTQSLDFHRFFNQSRSNHILNR